MLRNRHDMQKEMASPNGMRIFQFFLMPFTSVGHIAIYTDKPIQSNSPCFVCWRKKKFRRKQGCSESPENRVPKPDPKISKRFYERKTNQIVGADPLQSWRANSIIPFQVNTVPF